MSDLTVLLPTLGRSTLGRAVASVAAQTRPCDLIVAHDAEQIGQNRMLNRMLDGVRTPWVHTLGDDDTLEPHFAELLAAQVWDVDLIVFQMRYEDGRVLPEGQNLFFGGVGCSYAVKTEVARRMGGWPLDVCEDWGMIGAVLETGTVRVVPEVVYRVRH